MLQKEAAWKFAGIRRERQFSVNAKVIWDFQILYHFSRDDFIPAPAVDPVYLRIKRRKVPLISPVNYLTFQRFVAYGFGSWKPSLKHGCRKVFNYRQWKRLAHQLDFAVKSKPTELTCQQWVKLFRAFQELVPEEKRRLV